MSTPLDSALAYAARGWPVLPLHHPVQTGQTPVCSCSKCHKCSHVGKHPCFFPQTLEHGAHGATTSEWIIRDWFNRVPNANVGIAVGPASGLLVIDVDPRNGGEDTLAQVQAELGPLPETVEALTGGGGRHLLFKHPGGEVVSSLGPGLDILGSLGKLIVAEPSLHASGRRYCWEASSAPDSIALAQLPDSWTLRILQADAKREDRGYREDRETGNQGTHPTPVDPVIPVTPITPVSEWTEERLFRETLPTGRGHHDRCSMDFARGAKLNLSVPTPEAAQAMFYRWWNQAQRFCAEQDEDTAWCKFVRGFDAARLPLGVTNLASSAFEAAQRGPLPKAADRFPTPRLRLLVGVCSQMKRLTGGSFKLSCWQLAELFHVKPHQVWEWLRALERGLVLRCIDRGKGGATRGRAATFEYIADDLPAESG